MLLKKIILIFATLVLSAVLKKATAQGFETNREFDISILKDTLSMSSGQFGFNNFSISNFSNRKLNIGTKVELPRGWTLLRELPSYLEIPAGQSITIPLRIKASTETYGDKRYPIKLQFEDPLTGHRTIKIFEITINANTHWRANLLENTKFSYETEALPDFKFRIANFGNRVEAFDISFDSELRLTYPSTGFQIILKPGEDTLINVGIRSRTIGQVSDEIKVIIEARDMKKVLIQHLYIISNQYIPRETNRYLMPISVRWMGLNMLDPSNIYQYIEADGYLTLEKSRGISFKSRININSSDFRFNNNLFQLTYHTKNSNLGLGNHQDYMFTPIDGTGVKFDFRENRRNYEVFALKGRQINNLYLGLRQDIFMGNDAVINTEALYNRNQTSGVANIFGIHTYQKSFSNGDFLTVRGGYSTERAVAIGIQRPGYAGGYTFKLQRKFYFLRSNLQYFSGWFPGINRGMSSQNHEFNLTLGALRIGVFGTKMYQKANSYNFDFTETYLNFNTNSTEYGFQLGAKLFKGNLFLKVSNLYQVQYDEKNTPATSVKASLNYFVKTPNTEQIAAISVYKSNFLGEGIAKDILSYSSFISGKFRDFGYSARFNLGPIYYFDFVFMKNTGNFPTHQQHSIFYENSKAKKLKNRLSLNFFEMGRSVESSFHLRNDLFWDIPKHGLSINLLGSMNLLNPKATPSFNISITKTLKVPVPFFKKYNTLKVAMFKDKNNNDHWDKDEEAVSQANVLVNDKYLISNEKGEVTLKNVTKENYLINYSTVANQMGWIPKAIVSDTLSLKRDMIIQVPFKKSKVIEGTVYVTMAEYSNNDKPQLDGLQILATNSKGEIFKAITNTNGGFFFNLNEDIYTIQAPENLYGNNFYFQTSKTVVNLFGSEVENMDFELKEKTRQLNIRKLK